MAILKKNQAVKRVAPRPVYDEFQPETCRVIAYNKDHIQFVRRPVDFETYHLQNPNSLAHILTQTILLSMMKSHQINDRMNYGPSSQANKGYERPMIKVQQTETTKTSNGMVTRQLKPSSKEAEWDVIVEHSVKWLKGLIIQANGANGFNVIKQAEQDAIKHFTLQ